MSNEIDQLVCRQVLDRRVRRDVDELSVGDVVSVEVAGDLVEGTVDERHMAAVSAFQRGYPYDFHEGVLFRIEPKAGTDDAEPASKGEPKKRGRKPKVDKGTPAAVEPESPVAEATGTEPEADDTK